MIFKTIRQSLEDVYIAGRKINELNNLKLNATNVTAYATALKIVDYKKQYRTHFSILIGQVYLKELTKMIGMKLVNT